jgi:hypothetical protein
MRPRWLAILVAVALCGGGGGGGFGCGMMWKGPHDEEILNHQSAADQEREEREQRFQHHIERQSPDYRERVRKGQVSDY